MVATKATTVRGRLEHNVALSSMTSWRVGGAAEEVFWPADREDLIDYLMTTKPDVPVHFIGLGSNLLVRDAGVSGRVVVLHGALTHMDRVDETTIYVDAGVPCAKVARYSARCHLTGAEFLAGIPGTMGGALAMNAGAFGGETWNIVRSVDVVDAVGGVETLLPAEFDVAYRSVKGVEGRCFVGALLTLAPAGDLDPMIHIKQLLSKRNYAQPTGVFSCGSVFKNPPGDFAARLIESVGLKGARIGGAVVSEKHANFILNDRGESAADIEALIYHVRDRVYEETGVLLETEVRMIGGVQ